MSRRVVSLVPSLTEAVASVGADLLVGATDWCSHPTDLDVARIGGTKNPRVGQIVALRPDVVLANSEENRVPDLQALREAGVDVWLTGFETVPEALSGLAEMLRSLGLGSPDWLEAAWESWRQPWERPRLRGLVPIWRRPWMALGRDTFAGDVLSRVGLDNVLMSDPER
ncbi:MAG: helical backbone metal receptor, partial [Nocardioidaceae bacterium]